MNTTKKKLMNNPPVIKYYDVADEVVAFSTTRHGGFGKGAYSDFNINEYCGDDADTVIRNREALCEQLGMDAKNIIMPHQTHGTEIRVIGPEFLELSSNSRRMVLEGVDALMTSVRGVCIGVSTADCIPVLLYDIDSHAVCAVHAGWRGTVARIVQKAVKEMHIVFGTNAANLKAVIGPGISLDSFEVGDEVFDSFSEAGFDMQKISCRKNKWHIDLPECNRIQMLESGVGADNIYSCGICTYENVADYFSARRLGTESGRIFNAIYLR